jgi:hypothetical protein
LEAFASGAERRQVALAFGDREVHVLAAIGIFVLCFLSGSLSAKKAAGLIVTAIVMPAVAIG